MSTQSSPSPSQEKNNKNMHQIPHRRTSRASHTTSSRNPEFQNSLTSLHENIPIGGGSSPSAAGMNVEDCSSQRSSMTSLGSQDLELSVPSSLTNVTPGSSATSCDRFGRRPARRSLRDRSRNTSQQQTPQAAAESASSSQEIGTSAASGELTDSDPTAENRRGSWQFTSDWDSAMVYDSASSSFNCTASQASLYHVLDHLEEQDGKKNECDDDKEQLVFDEDQSKNVINCSNNVGGDEGSIDVSDSTTRTDNISLASNLDSFEMKLGSSLTIPSGGGGRVLPQRGLSRKASQKSFRRSVHDTLKQDEDAVSEYFRNSGGTHLTDSTTDGDDLEHAFGDLDLLVDGS